MSVDVKVHFTCSSDSVVLASGVRVTARRVVSGCEMFRDVLVVRVGMRAIGVVALANRTTGSTPRNQGIQTWGLVRPGAMD